MAVPVVADASDKALGLLRGWDGSAVMDSPAPLIFNAWMETFYAAVLRHAGLMTGIGAPVSDFVASVLAPGGGHWCGGDCAPMLRDALADAMRDLASPLRRRPFNVAMGGRASGGVRPSDFAQRAHPGIAHHD